jgi:hypothetical protein
VQQQTLHHITHQLVHRLSPIGSAVCVVCASQQPGATALSIAVVDSAAQRSAASWTAAASVVGVGPSSTLYPTALNTTPPAQCCWWRTPQQQREHVTVPLAAPTLLESRRRLPARGAGLQHGQVCPAGHRASRLWQGARVGPRAAAGGGGGGGGRRQPGECVGPSSVRRRGRAADAAASLPCCCCCRP